METNITSHTGSKVAYPYMVSIGKEEDGESAQKNLVAWVQEGFLPCPPPLTLVCPNETMLTPSSASPSNNFPRRQVLSNKPRTYLALKTGEISLDNFEGLLNTSRRLSGIYSEKYNNIIYT